ncbi:protein cycle-like isoform X2 [Ornithodoros turicata]|uniref:Putative hypoxia-inducible factor 1/neuronal pas domain protein npas1 n=2 Tax=Ornithodoros turicata TaxID=34597 RepID=A0A2R5LHP5_9ACAR
MTMPVKNISGGGGGAAPPATDPLSTSSRLQRNFAEKQRRDKLNSYINELANIVPMVSMASKRLDKTSILRLSAAHLRFYQTPLVSGADRGGKVAKPTKWRPKFLNVDHLKDLLEVVEGFVLVTSTTGKIIYISPSVERYLGHQNIEMIGHSIFTFLHSADVQAVHDCFESLLQGPMRRRGDTYASDRCSFFCRIRERSQPRSEVLTYQVIQVVGHLTGPAEGNSEQALVASGGRSFQDEDEEDVSQGGSNYLFKTFVRVVNTSPYKELSLMDAIQDEYVTRHKLDGTIIFADHRLSTLTGHLPHEVQGISAHKYLHPSDVAIALFAQKQMFANDSGKGVVVYRLRTRDDSFIFLRSAGYLQYDQATMQVDHFVCINSLMTQQEGEKELRGFFDRFSPHITSLTVQELNEFFSSMQASTLRRLQRAAEALGPPGLAAISHGGEPTPSLARVVEPNLYLGSNCLVKVKREPHDLRGDALLHMDHEHRFSPPEPPDNQ